MTALLSADEKAAQRVRLSLGETVAQYGQARELYRNVEAADGENLVIIGPDIRFDEALEISERFRALRPTLGVVLLRSRVEMSVLSDAMRAGIREVIAADDNQGILNACRRSLEVTNRMLEGSSSATPMKKGKLIIVFSAKGGCGKTTISTNLAEALSRKPDQSVCIVDFDLQFGDVAVALQISPTKSISDAIGMQSHLDRRGVTSLVIPYRPNLHVLLAPSNPTDVEFITSSLAEKLLGALQEVYDYVVVDSPPAFTEVILKTFDMADEYVLLTTLDLPSVKNLRVTLATLDALGLPQSKWRVIVNRADTRLGLSIRDVEDAIGFPVTGTVPSSRDVPARINQGLTMVASEPRHPVSKAVIKIAQLVETKAPKNSKGSSVAIRRVFSRSK